MFQTCDACGREAVVEGENEVVACPHCGHADLTVEFRQTLTRDKLERREARFRAAARRKSKTKFKVA